MDGLLMALGTSTATDFLEGSSFGVTNSTTAVTTVAAPASGKRRLIRSVSIHNNDTVSSTVTIRLDNNGTKYILHKEAIDSGKQLLYERVIVLAATTESLEIVLGGAITTNQLDYYAVYAEVS
jgi:hypothetical protein